MSKRGSRKVESLPDVCETWELEYSPIWHVQENKVIPSPLCLRWWQSLAEKKYRDRQRWLEVAHQLGYITKSTNLESGNITYEPYGFEYDGSLIRKSLGLPKNGPLVFSEMSIDNQPYHQLWNKLLREESHEGSSDLG
jgi:hypothetical protein